MADPPFPERTAGGAPRPGCRCMPAGDWRRPPPLAALTSWREPGLRPCPPWAAPAVHADRQLRLTAFVLETYGRAPPPATGAAGQPGVDRPKEW